MYKLIACDLDETLLDRSHLVCPRNVEAVRAVRERGVRFVIATGRGFPSVRYELETLGLADEPGEYTIALNGATILENRHAKLLAFDGVSLEFADEMYRRGLEYDVCVHVYTPSTVYARGMTDEERRYLGRKLEGIVEVDSRTLDFLHGEPVAKILYSNTDMEYLKSIAREVEPLTRDADVTYSSNRYLEFNRKGVNKGAGLLHLANMLDIAPEETVAIGDNWNDAPMLEAAGLAAGVANVVPELRSCCDYVAQADSSAGGVAEVIEKFVLGM